MYMGMCIPLFVWACPVKQTTEDRYAGDRAACSRAYGGSAACSRAYEGSASLPIFFPHLLNKPGKSVALTGRIEEIRPGLGQCNALHPEILR